MRVSRRVSRGYQLLSPEHRRTRRVAQALAAWAQDNLRAFPWREYRREYEILVAEVLLQRTRVKDPLTGEQRPISLEVHAQDGSATSEQAVSMGLIVTELVLNALKHAFPDGREGCVLVAYDVAGPNWRLTVSDDGIGRPDEDAPMAVPGLGTNLVEALANQLDARVESRIGPTGTIMSITHASFPSRLPTPETAA